MFAAMDYGTEPFVDNILQAACQNNNFRRALWTGEHLQLTLMSIPVNGEIGLEMHEDTDQFLCVAAGSAFVKMGECPDKLCFQKCINAKEAVFVPAGTWHNLVNTGHRPLKLYSLYAPPKHPRGTVHRTKAIADRAEQEMD
jgi:mannose-6-phosphate isomerase-like protein (cupin superfamily)